MVFNSFEINDDSNLTPLCEVDPDLNFFNSLSQFNNCNYYLEDTFNDKFKTVNSDELSFIHFNIRSGVRNLDRFTRYLDSLTMNFSCIGLSETWLSEKNFDLYNIQGYTSIHAYRSKRNGGGVSIFIKDSIIFNERHDLGIFNEYIESVFIEVSKHFIGVSRDVVIGVVYRPPNSDVEIFNDTLNELLTKVKNEKKYCCLMGDFNLNLLNHETHAGTCQFLDILYSNLMFPLITKPTRVSKESATLIDNIFFNCHDDMKTCNGILCTDITDHFPVFAIFKETSTASNINYVYKRDYSQSNIDKFMATLSSFNWNSVTNIGNCAEAFTFFHTEFQRMYQQCFPNRILKCGYKTRMCWLSAGLKNSIKIKNKLYLVSKRFPSDENIHCYKMYKNKLRKLLRAAEKQYFHDLLETNRNNLKRSWSIIKSVINKKHTGMKSQEFSINGETCSNQQKIANAFNQFFVNIGKNLN